MLLRLRLDLDAQDRIAAQLEEVVMPPHLRNVQHLRPDLRQRLFHLALGRLVRVGSTHSARFRQRRLVDLPVGRQRQPV
ncbi:hypothetical protein, partial [Xanthomonas sp. BRIP62415]|uniref:hypothetical protein n=1 Tax=Xanthomonas sp. BRIP62415 TaxID=2182390 RepID=UPI0019D2A484